MSGENAEIFETTQEVSPQVIYQQDKAQIDVQISTAKAYPRNIQRAAKNCTDIVSFDQATAQTCTYTVPRGGKSITGPSVHLARIMAQQWGNLRIESKVVDISQTQITSEAVCFDLETNVAIKTQVKRSITNKYGKRFKDDMVTVTGNGASAIAFRNAVLAVIPRPIVDAVYNAALKTITGDVSDEIKLRKRSREVVDRLMAAYSITEAEVLSSIGKATVDFVDVDDIATLIGIGTAIKEGDTTVDLAFRRDKTSTSPLETTSEEEPKERAIKLVDTASKLADLETRISTMPDAMKEELKEAIALKRSELTVKGISESKTLKTLEKFIESLSPQLQDFYSEEINAKREEIVKE